MSADNWTICPRCLAEAKRAQEAAIANAAEAYGKVDPNQYLALLDASKRPINVGDSMREDYSIGTSKDGIFEVHYGCQCECGFKFKFTHKQGVPA